MCPQSSQSIAPGGCPQALYGDRRVSGEACQQVGREPAGGALGHPGLCLCFGVEVQRMLGLDPQAHHQCA